MKNRNDDYKNTHKYLPNCAIDRLHIMLVLKNRTKTLKLTIYNIWLIIRSGDITIKTGKRKLYLCFP